MRDATLSFKNGIVDKRITYLPLKRKKKKKPDGGAPRAIDKQDVVGALEIACNGEWYAKVALTSSVRYVRSLRRRRARTVES